MYFNNPTALWGMLLLAIPIIIHLFYFQRARKVYFTNVAFLQQTQQDSKAARKLKELLALLFRLLAVAAIVLAFALPTLKTSSVDTKGQKAITYIYIDNSLSTTIKEKNEDILTKEIKYAENLVLTADQGAGIQVITNNFNSEDFNPTTKQNALLRVRAISASNNTKSISQVLARIGQINASLYPLSPFKIFYLSDFQKSTVQLTDNTSQEIRNNTIFLPFNNLQRGNIFIDSIYTKLPVTLPNQPQEIEIIVTNTGDLPVQNSVVKINEADNQVAIANVNLEANESKKLIFALKNNTQNQAYKVTVEDQITPFDNVFYFRLASGSSANVIQIYNNDKESEYIKKALANKNVASLNSYQIDRVNFQTLGQADCIFLNGLTSISPSIETACINAIKNGKTVVLIPPKTGKIIGITSLLYYTKTTVSGLEQPQESQELAMPASNNNLFDGVFENNANKAGMPSVQPVWSITGFRPLIKTVNGNIALGEILKGNGKLLVLSMPLDLGKRPLAFHSIFVPLVIRLTLLSNSIRPPLYLSAGIPSVKLNIDSLSKNKENIYYLKKRSSNNTIISEGGINGKILTLQMPDAMLNPGIYDIYINKNEASVSTIAVNTKSSESDLVFYSSSDLTALADKQPLLKIENTISESSFSASANGTNMGKNLWFYCVIAAVIFAFSEIIILRTWPTKV